MPDIAFFEVFQEEAAVLKRFLPKTLCATFSEKTIQAANPKKVPAGLISIRTQSVIPAAWEKDLQGVLTRSSGYDHLSRLARRIPCGYLPNYCVRAVAEQAILLALALMRRLPLQMKQMAAFQRSGMTGRELLNKKLFVLGVGRIGSEVVTLARGMGMHVRGADLVPRSKDLDYVSLAAGLNWAEMVICCLPLTQATQGMLNKKAFPSGAQGIVLVNVGRGEVTPLADMKKLLDSGVLAGLGLDVYEDEPVLAETLRQKNATRLSKLIFELKARDNVIFTPHNAFNTQEAVERKVKESIAAVNYFLAKKTFPDLVAP